MLFYLPNEHFIFITFSWISQFVRVLFIVFLIKIKVSPSTEVEETNNNAISFTIGKM